MPEGSSHPLHVVVLAAGEGKRMRSRLPKVMLPVGGRPMLSHVLDAVAELDPQETHVVYGHGGDAVLEAFPDSSARWVAQGDRLGTGHAVQQAMPAVPDEAVVLVLYGDTPLVPAPALRQLVAEAGDGLAILTMEPDDPAGYGRVLRDRAGNVTGIVEEKDADPEQRQVREVNTGLLAARASLLREWLNRVDNDNAQGEYYLTDVIGLAHGEGLTVRAIAAPDPTRLLGANDRWQLARLERRYQALQAEILCRQGVTVLDPSRLDVRGTVSVGRDVVLDVNVVLEGEVLLADGVVVEPNCVLRDVRVGEATRILAGSHLERTVVGNRCRVGPFARLRPGTELADGAAVGNFVEVKQSRIGPGSKVNHLSYVGDAELGPSVNIGAGTITCNYDGARKHRTRIGEAAFIGSNTSLVAPVTIGDGATIGAGSTISKDAPPGKLTVSRARQTTIEGWRRPGKRET